MEVMVALQGTLESFSLTDVLRLLASTKKTGLLTVTNDRGQGDLGLRDGEVLWSSASQSPRARDAADVLFELLRDRTGTFIFDAEVEIESGDGPPSQVEAMLAMAEEYLAEWREIEASVPSMARTLALVADRGDREITLKAEQWQAIVNLKDQDTVATLGERLDLPDLSVARLVRDLIDLEAVVLGDTDVAPEPPAAMESEPEVASEMVAEIPETLPVPEPEPVDSWASDSWNRDSFDTTSFNSFESDVSTPSNVASFPNGESSDSNDDAVAPVAPLFGGPSEFFSDNDPFGPDPFTLVESPDEPASERPSQEAAEMARQLANLSPRAAQAVAAAAAATTDEERDQALDRVSDETGDPVNRGLLLKFLSSVEE